MNLDAYERGSTTDSNLWWRLSSGTHLNLLDEAIDQRDECRRLLREACSCPAVVSSGDGSKCVHLTVEWLTAAKAAGGDDAD